MSLSSPTSLANTLADALCGLPPVRTLSTCEVTMLSVHRLELSSSLGLKLSTLTRPCSPSLWEASILSAPWLGLPSSPELTLSPLTQVWSSTISSTFWNSSKPSCSLTLFP